MHTFRLPIESAEAPADPSLGPSLLRSWQTDGVFQLELDDVHANGTTRAIRAGRDFFALPDRVKRYFVSDLTYSGYVARGEHVPGAADSGVESFTVCPDLAYDDARVLAGWPGHGPVPWPYDAFRTRMLDFAAVAGKIAQRLLGLLEPVLAVASGSLTDLGRDGWHHLRVARTLRPADPDAAPAARIESSPGLLTIAVPHVAAHLHVFHQNSWQRVEAGARTWAVFPGEAMQFLTGGRVSATPYKVMGSAREQHVLAYHHGPRFCVRLQPLLGATGDDDRLHYATHLTNLFLREFPARAVSRRIIAERRLDVFRRALACNENL
ncbi:MAG TPA: 2-oxoglutarate and iron-dependent oxygenase domain-containing protein [Actinocrinis sp.]|uniref:2-oxoglutarate and iron-dependent oxygenase domain-containing protein n=1 Tax=Actinocrinis sp. TaxID=1920516 RepID=UPI002DDD856E|nr:2-oxoglutarate and iron-dependent oxygenase domain-containing protein [Actinocrinis sp.]HEV2347700.1 2-oxoglutarate and iron-dependent oxygenase domain-containing protein [Actinocrinis sp.]